MKDGEHRHSCLCSVSINTPVCEEYMGSSILFILSILYLSIIILIDSLTVVVNNLILKD